MEMPTEFARNIFEYLNKYGAIASAILTLAGAIFASRSTMAWLEKSLTFRRESEVFATSSRYSVRDNAYAGSTVSPSQVARQRAITRLDEAKQAMTSGRSSERIARISSNLLTVGQYIIGGVLASSFVQESLSPKAVGLLGVLVLIASLVKQQFHPELNAEKAGRKISQLKALIRISEDQLTILDAKIASGQDHSDAMIALLTQITQRLNEIENPETNESMPHL